jgi:hypothetical protein
VPDRPIRGWRITVVLLVRGDRGLGLGLIIGWALGPVVLPMLAFTLLLAIFATEGGSV